jgi:hypothetical protein
VSTMSEVVPDSAWNGWVTGQRTLADDRGQLGVSGEDDEDHEAVVGGFVDAGVVVLKELTILPIEIPPLDSAERPLQPLQTEQQQYRRRTTR